ncbi:MAG: hypothetical protein R6U53_13525, partial [Natronomonas sp.]
GSSVVLTTLVTGCLGDDSEGEGGDDTGDGNGNDNGSENGDSDEMSIDGRLHNESDDTQTFAVVILDKDDETVAEDEWEVNAGSTKNIPAFGKPGDPRTFEVTVAESEATETFEFDVENTPDQKDGYVDITYTKEEGDLEVVFTPAEDDED